MWVYRCATCLYGSLTFRDFGIAPSRTTVRLFTDVPPIAAYISTVLCLQKKALVSR